MNRAESRFEVGDYVTCWKPLPECSELRGRKMQVVGKGVAVTRFGRQFVLKLLLVDGNSMFDTLLKAHPDVLVPWEPYQPSSWEHIADIWIPGTTREGREWDRLSQTKSPIDEAIRREMHRRLREIRKNMGHDDA